MMKKRSLYIFASISYLILLGYFIMPFINGLGCNFKYSTESTLMSSVGTCHFGVLSTVQIEKKTGKVFKFYALLGLSGNYLYTINLSRHELSSNNLFAGIDNAVYLDELYRERPVRVFYLFGFKNDKNRYVLLSERPVDLLIEARFHGRLSIIQP